MSHKPECNIMPSCAEGACDCECICDQLRAAYRRGIADARDAVAALPYAVSNDVPVIVQSQALAAIDALKEDK